MYDNDNIFAKIIKGQIPCKKVYEDDDVLFFEDINPASKVHVLGVPKVKCVDFSDFVYNNHKDINFLFIDGNHTYASALADFLLYYPLVKKGGMVIVVGLYGGSLKLSLPLVPMRSMSLRGSYVGELRELKELVNIIKSGKIKLIPVKKQGLETANQAMSDLRSGKVNGRIVLIPD